jgi:hypothetical protein
MTEELAGHLSWVCTKAAALYSYGLRIIVIIIEMNAKVDRGFVLINFPVAVEISVHYYLVLPPYGNWDTNLDKHSNN